MTDTQFDQNENIVERGQILGKLLRIANIQKLVVIDDWYVENKIDIETITAHVLAAPEKYLSLIPDLATFDKHETDFISNRVRKALVDTKIADQARQICATDTEENAGLDFGTMSVLDRLIQAIPEEASVNVFRLSNSEWQTSAENILNPTTGETLLLVDRDFAREGKSENHGLTLISGLVESNPESVHCALLSHTIAPGDELDRWNALADEHSIPQHKFVVISKTRLADEQSDLDGFLNLMRLSILCGPLKDLRDKVRDHFASALDTTRSDLEAWSVFDFDEAIFGSSRKEGIWEGETLLRVMTTFMTRAAKEGVLGDSEVRNTINLARQASSVAISDGLHPWKRVGQMALEYQKSELYLNDSDINTHNLPIEAGDIFDRGDDSEAYILLAQPCDLMVRGSSGRSYDTNKFTKMVPLCVVKNGPTPDPSHSYELKFWQSDGSSAYVHFAQTHLVRIVMLDLCVLRDDGRAIFDNQSTLPNTLNESWEQYAKKFLKQLNAESSHASQLIEHIQGKQSAIPKQLKALAVAKILPCCSNTNRFKSEATTQGFSVNLRRVKRVNSFLTSDILRRFAHYQSRTAFEQSVITEDLQRRMDVTAES